MTDKDALGAALDSACDGLVDEVATMIGANGMERRALRYAEAEMRNRLASIDLPTPPQPFDAAGIEYGDAAQDAVMRLLETGWATVNSAGYLARALPEAPASVEPVAWLETCPNGSQRAFINEPDHDVEDIRNGWKEAPLYTRPEPDTIGSHPPTSGGGDLREADSILRELVEAVNHASWSDNGAVEKAMTRAAEYVIDHPPLAALSHDQRGGAGE